MFKTQEELEKLKKEMQEIEKKNTELENLMKTVDDFQADQNFKEIKENSNNQDEILSQHNAISTNKNETIDVLKPSEDNLGGWESENGTLGTLVVLENNGQDWKQLNIKLLYGVESHGAQFLNNNLYIFGGWNQTKKELNWTYKLSKSLQWEKMTDMNEKRDGVSNSSVILNNQIWVCGGFNGNDDLNSVEMYDPLTNNWKYVKPMNQCRANSAVAVVNGKIFCSGGEWTDSVECYDPSSDVWTPIFDMLQSTWGHGAVEMDGNFIIIGGHDERKESKYVWAIDTTDKKEKWIAKPSMSIRRHSFSIAKIDDKIFICGGSPKLGESTDSVEIFDGEVWRNGPKMPMRRKYAPAVVIPVEFARELEQFTDVPIEKELWRCPVQ